MKKIIILFLALLIPIIVNANTEETTRHSEEPQTEEAEVTNQEQEQENETPENERSLARNSEASILMEASTGQILFEHNAHARMAPASMTKIMTMLLIMEAIESERISLTDEVLITPNAARMGGSQVFLEAGSKMKVEDLLKAIAIASANDASVAMAEYISGTNETFVTKMNERCKELGCQNTNFMNSHGLDHEEHFSSAADMALISRELIRHEAILAFTSIYEEHLNKPDGITTWMVNTNRLIRFYQGMDGLKTGFTGRAGYCLTSTAIRNDMRLITVVMNAPTPNERTTDTVELLNYGFSNYKVKTILDTNHNLGEIELINGKSKTVNIRLLNDATELENINEELNYTYNINVEKKKAPVRVGDIVGELEVVLDNEVISRHPITVVEDVGRANLWDLYRRNLQMFLVGR